MYPPSPSRKCILIVCMLFAVFFAGCRPFAKKIKPQNGVLDISAWNFDKAGTLQLDGEWQFYWQQLYTPADFAGDTSIRPTGLITVPSDWNGQHIGNVQLSGQGYATYRLQIKAPPGKFLGLHVPDAYSCYKLWVNGVLIASNGVPATNAIGEVPELKPMIVAFKTQQANDVVMQVSNFFQSKGGANSSYTIGTTEQIIRKREADTIATMFIIGMLTILFIYHLCIFVLSSTDYVALWFGIFCIFLAGRFLVTSEKFITVICPGFSPILAARIEYASVFVGCMIFALFIRSLFPKDFSGLVLKIICVSGVIEFVAMAFLPTRLFTSLLICYQVTTLVVLLYTLWVTIKAARNKRLLANSMLIVISVMIVLGINDTLYAWLIVNTSFMISLALPFLLAAQAYLIAHRIGSALNSVEKLSIELNDANINLEQKVLDRTSELEAEKKKTDDLLLNILPAETAEELKAKGHADARTYSMVSVMFIDMVGFSELSKTFDATLLVTEMHYYFSAFDKIIDKHRVEKIKTIGNTYLCAAGLPVPNLTHAEDLLKAAYEIRSLVQQRAAEQRSKNGIVFDIRIGINTGPLVAGIVGTKKFAYDIWGDTVNTAARMEQNSTPGKINISGKTYELVKSKFHCTHRGKLEAKNKGMIDMYYVEQN